MASPDQAVGNLSGGNQQKVVLARWLALQPKVLIVDEPTRGIDVAAKAEVHALLYELAGAGIAILAISSELPEILTISDRIVTMREGRVTGEVMRAEATRGAADAADGAGAGGGRVNPLADAAAAGAYHPRSRTPPREQGSVGDGRQPVVQQRGVDREPKADERARKGGDADADPLVQGRREAKTAAPGRAPPRPAQRAAAAAVTTSGSAPRRRPGTARPGRAAGRSGAPARPASHSGRAPASRRAGRR